MRCFIGIMLPNELKEKLENFKEKLKGLPMKCKFVERENFHICLSFLGEKREEEVRRISDHMDEIARSFEPFEVKIEELKLIPNERFIRVIAFDVKDEEKMVKLQTEIRKRIGGDSKPPHVTICRVKHIENKQTFLDEVSKFVNEEIGKMEVSKIQLIKSELSRRGPAYSIIHESSLSS